MRAFLLILFATGLLLPTVLHAQAGTWCGYALIEGLTVPPDELGILELISTPRTRQAQPDELFQYRYSLDGTKVIIEGCFRTTPSRAVIAFLLGGVGFDAIQLNTQLIYSLFAPGRDRSIGAASVRLYLAQNRSEWELPDDTQGQPIK